MSYTGPLALGLNDDKPQASAPSKATILAVVVGNALEWYEIVVYGYLAAVIAALFFPPKMPAPRCCLLLAASD